MDEASRRGLESALVDRDLPVDSVLLLWPTSDRHLKFGHSGRVLAAQGTS